MMFYRCDNSLQLCFRLISANDTVYMDIPVSDCGVSYIEHIELVMTIKYSKRGDLSIDLTSAQGGYTWAIVTFHGLLVPRLIRCYPVAEPCANLI